MPFCHQKFPNEIIEINKTLLFSLNARVSFFFQINCLFCCPFRVFVFVSQRIFSDVFSVTVVQLNQHYLRSSDWIYLLLLESSVRFVWRIRNQRTIKDLTRVIFEQKVFKRNRRTISNFTVERPILLHHDDGLECRLYVPEHQMWNILLFSKEHWKRRTESMSSARMSL